MKYSILVYFVVLQYTVSNLEPNTMISSYCGAGSDLKFCAFGCCGNNKNECCKEQYGRPAIEGFEYCYKRTSSIQGVYCRHGCCDRYYARCCEEELWVDKELTMVVVIIVVSALLIAFGRQIHVRRQPNPT